MAALADLFACLRRSRYAFRALFHLTVDISGRFVTIIFPLDDNLNTISYIVPWISTTLAFV
jgi:hypothetical protein